jgi:hypothetical protein
MLAAEVEQLVGRMSRHQMQHRLVVLAEEVRVDIHRLLTMDLLLQAEPQEQTDKMAEAVEAGLAFPQAEMVVLVS